MTLWIGVVIETLLDALPFLSLSEKEKAGIRDLIKWRNGKLADHDETMIGSDRNYLLIATSGKLHLIHRHKKWRGELDELAESFYMKRGNKAFRRMHMHLLKTARK